MKTLAIISAAFALSFGSKTEQVKTQDTSVLSTNYSEIESSVEYNEHSLEKLAKRRRMSEEQYDDFYDEVLLSYTLEIDNTFILDYSIVEEGVITLDEYNVMLEHYESLNSSIQSGDIYVDQNGNILETEPENISRSRRNQTKIQYKWWGYIVYLSNNAANEAVKEFNSHAANATYCGAIATVLTAKIPVLAPVAATCLIAGGYFWKLASDIDKVNSANTSRGVKITNYAWGVVFTVKSQ